MNSRKPSAMATSEPRPAAPPSPAGSATAAVLPDASEPRDLAPRPGWLTRNAVWVTGLSQLVPQLIGSTFNISYNIYHVQPLLDEAQFAAFESTIKVFNVTVYPLATVIWIWLLTSLHRSYSRLLREEWVDPDRLAWSRRMAINLPLWGVCLGAVGWLLCIPVFLTTLTLAPGQLDPRVYAQLPTSFLISALIATTHAFFILELFSQRLLYPVFFRDCQPADTPGARTLSLKARGLLWVLSAGVCPIGSLLLLMVIPHQHVGFPWFGLTVGGIGIAFGLTTAWLVGLWVTEPVNELKRAARAVAAGDLSAHVGLLRADDFGPLIDEFNQMVGELRDKQQLQEIFGRHVGEQAAKLILDRDPGLGGYEETVTVMFVDIRNFTARCERSEPRNVVVVLNLFLTDMVEVVEAYGGMVNKFLGDGFMAIFGVRADAGQHADAAIAAGRDMLSRLGHLNARLQEDGYEPLEIGVGIHTGPTIVGSIGSPRRMEFTAIGNTVNVASRVEGLTKLIGESLLFTPAARDALQFALETEELPPQRVKGQSEPLRLCRIKT